MTSTATAARPAAIGHRIDVPKIAGPDVAGRGAAVGAGFAARTDTLVSRVADGQLDPLRTVAVGIGPLLNCRGPDSRSRFTR